MSRSPITTHVLDTGSGRPAAGLTITLERAVDGGFERVASSQTNADGRIGDLMAPGTLQPGTLRMTFETGRYYAAQDQKTFYPSVTVLFEIERTDEHYHVPLLLSPFGYSTYRGS